jgi:hypothetical protein
MMNFIVKERRGGHKTTSWCNACTELNAEPTDGTCEACQGFVTTYVRCPKCEYISFFYGFDEPSMCERCAAIYPSINQLKTENPISRVEYHLDKVLS